MLPKVCIVSFMLLSAAPFVLGHKATVCRTYEESELKSNPECTRQSILHRKTDCKDLQQLKSKIDNLEKKSTNCPSIKYHFPRDGSTADYARYRSYVPRRKEGTVCMWVETQGYEADLTGLFSYSKVGNDNELLVYFIRSQVALCWAKGKYRHFGNFNTTIFQKQVHICVWFSSTKQLSRLYLNGEFFVEENAAISDVEGGGDMILAQEQDAANAKGLDRTEAFTGIIINPMIRPRVLTSDEIRNIATSCQCPQDYAVAMTVDTTEVYGEAYYSIPEECPIL